LLPILLIFIWRLAASRELMGEYRNGRAFIAGFTVVATSTLSILLLAITFVSIA
jgi:Mn2+/Fe2+ NRAMP family transporter